MGDGQMDQQPPVTIETIREMALALPEVEERTAYGTPSFHVKKKFLGQLQEDGDSFVIRVNELERNFLLQVEPDIYYITDHYVGYPYILVRLSKANVNDLRRMIEAAWHQLAPKQVIKAYDNPG